MKANIFLCHGLEPNLTDELMNINYEMYKSTIICSQCIKIGSILSDVKELCLGLCP